MKDKVLIYNAKIYTQFNNQVVSSMALDKRRIIAIGDNLQQSPQFKHFSKINLKKKTIVPGFVDAHTHFHYFAQSFCKVSLDGLDSLEKCLSKIKTFAATLKKNEWVVGEGYSVDFFKKRIEPDKFMLDKVSGGRPAIMFTKDQHTAWVNSKALQLAGISSKTRDPAGGRIEKLSDANPSGILREPAAYSSVSDLLPEPSTSQMNRFYQKALDWAYRKGVTGVHSFDGNSLAFEWYQQLSEKKKLGLRINYYFQESALPTLLKNKIRYGQGDEFLRIAGIKIFSDGALGSKTALCHEKYKGSKSNFGIEVRSIKQMLVSVKQAAKLGLPAAIHAIGDKAVSNVLDVFEKAPKLKHGARHRIEHYQLARRKDVERTKRLNVVTSMQPSHCPSDIKMIRKHWGKRGADAFIFRTLIDKGIDLAFGSDVPIEPLDPIAGIAAAIRRARPNSRDIFYPSQRITVLEALNRFTLGPAIAVGQQDCRGMLIPGYPADFVVLSDDIAGVPASKIYDIKVLATILDGDIKYCDSSLKL
ncbi:MAG: amidohydrolase [candidate division Zixibacteria bacterium]|nr:amidohydrolase [candidate division Zixibacteria bacterium]